MPGETRWVLFGSECGGSSGDCLSVVHDRTNAIGQDSKYRESMHHTLWGGMQSFAVTPETGVTHACVRI